MPDTGLRFPDIPDDEFCELRDLYLSRLMFNEFVGWPRETRSFEEFIADQQQVRRDV